MAALDKMKGERKRLTFGRDWGGSAVGTSSETEEESSPSFTQQNYRLSRVGNLPPHLLCSRHERYEAREGREREREEEGLAYVSTTGPGLLPRNQFATGLGFDTKKKGIHFSYNWIGFVVSDYLRTSIVPINHESASSASPHFFIWLSPSTFIIYEFVHGHASLWVDSDLDHLILKMSDPFCRLDVIGRPAAVKKRLDPIRSDPWSSRKTPEGMCFRCHCFNVHVLVLDRGKSSWRFS